MSSWQTRALAEKVWKLSMVPLTQPKNPLLLALLLCHAAFIRALRATTNRGGASFVNSLEHRSRTKLIVESVVSRWRTSVAVKLVMSRQQTYVVKLVVSRLQTRITKFVVSGWWMRMVQCVVCRWWMRVV